MKIQTAATRIISCWEHTGHYDCHGDGAYGLIGWEGEELRGLLHKYIAAGGNLNNLPSWYADNLELSHDGQESEHLRKAEDDLNIVAENPLMQKVQREQAAAYMERAIKWQWHYYPFATALGQLICCDMGVNSGIKNFYVKHSGMTLKDNEFVVLTKTLEYRRQIFKKYGIWRKYAGIRRRWAFYDDLLGSGGDADMSLRSIQPSVMVNGVNVELGDEPISVLAP